jgi:hypothetical protein
MLHGWDRTMLCGSRGPIPRAPQGSIFALSGSSRLNQCGAGGDLAMILARVVPFMTSAAQPTSAMIAKLNH